MFRSCCTRVKEKPCTLNGWGLHVSDSVQVCFKHFLCRHLFFFRPGPPNLGMSRHVLHVPQFSFVQPAHLQFDPLSAVYNCQMCYMYSIYMHVQCTSVHVNTLMLTHTFDLGDSAWEILLFIFFSLVQPL